MERDKFQCVGYAHKHMRLFPSIESESVLTVIQGAIAFGLSSHVVFDNLNLGSSGGIRHCRHKLMSWEVITS